MNMPAFPNSGRALRIVLTYFLNDRLALIVLNGLITLKTLKGLRFILTATSSIILYQLIIYDYLTLL